jgi:hypothetical protein
MSADRELLELAAKAAGIYVKHPVFNQDDDLIALRVKPSVAASRQTITDWNPLTDDGDALRLAVKLKMKVQVWESTGEAIATWGTFEVSEPCTRGKDPFAATRRAIVRCAAMMPRRATTQTESDKP